MREPDRRAGARPTGTGKSTLLARLACQDISAGRGVLVIDPKGNDLLDAILHPLGKNPGDVWNLATAGYRGAHHAVFPTGIPERAIRAGCPEKRCSRCRMPWTREKARRHGHLAVLGEIKPSCGCGAPPEPGVVLDPFIGSGTTAIAAEKLGRRWLGIEINPAFAALAQARIVAAREAGGMGRQAA